MASDTPAPSDPQPTIRQLGADDQDAVAALKAALAKLGAPTG